MFNGAEIQMQANAKKEKRCRSQKTDKIVEKKFSVVDVLLSFSSSSGFIKT